MNIIPYIALLVISVGVATAQASDDVIPEWIKATAGWWADDITSDAEFVAAITHLI